MDQIVYTRREFLITETCCSPVLQKLKLKKFKENQAQLNSLITFVASINNIDYEASKYFS